MTRPVPPREPKDLARAVSPESQLPVPSPAGKRTVVSRADFAEFLPDIESVTEGRHSPMARLLIFLIAGFFLTALLWAHLAEVEQVASAPGVIRPIGQIKTINHPEGGRVAELLVTEGQVLEAGQILLKLDPEFFAEMAARQTNEWQALAAEVARLEAEGTGAAEVELPADLLALRPDLQATQERLFEARREAVASRRNAADELVRRRQSEASVLVQSKKRLQDSLAILREKEEALGELVDKGYYPRLQHLELLGEISDREGQIAEIRNRLAAAYSGLEEAKSQRLSVDQEARAEVLDQLEIRRREHDTVLSDLQQTKAQLRNLEIRSPVAGVVQNLAVTSSGQAIRPNEPIMNVVPSGDSLVVETSVSNDDIGYISIGQRAKVKVQTYDFIVHGALNGVVEQVAADATEDEQSGEFSFKVSVRTDRNYLGEESLKRVIQPGMLVIVDLQIGERSILSYLTDRVLRTTESAFREH